MGNGRKVSDPARHHSVFEDLSGRRARRVRLLVLPLLVMAGGAGVLTVASVTAPSQRATVDALPGSTPQASLRPDAPFAVGVVERSRSGPPQPCSEISGVVFTDHDRNGARQANEPGVAGLAVGAFDQDGVLVTEAVSSAEGRWRMSLGSQQIVRLVAWSPNESMYPAPRGAESDPWASTVSAPDCGADLGMVWEEAAPSPAYPAHAMELGDRVWSDEDCDGWQDPLEPGLAAIRVRLYDEVGRTLAETVTNNDGEYLFGGIQPARSYRVEIVFTDASSISAHRAWPSPAVAADEDQDASPENTRLRHAFGSSDSDGRQSGPVQAVAERSVQVAGASEHGVDFGLVPLKGSSCAPPSAATEPSPPAMVIPTED